ncbi:MAG: hypothetical protein ACREDR_04230 [Blastocatellia bacterium]
MTESDNACEQILGAANRAGDNSVPGFCRSKGTFAGRFIIPLQNETGEMVGYAGRSVDNSEPKYLFPPSSKGIL